MTDTEIKPIPVTVIGSTGNGDTTPLQTGLIAQTPGASQPNLTVRVITPLMAIAVRAGNVFFVTLGGLVGGQAVGAITAISFEGMVFVALAAVGVGVIKDMATLFTGLERKFPLATGSV